MTGWTRAKLNTLCGNCPTVIKAGAPIFEIKHPLWTHPKVRCEACAGEPVPAEIPEIVTQAESIKAKLAQRIDQIRPTRDFKVAQGERE